jgi:SAM-dependent methyltransferase
MSSATDKNAVTLRSYEDHAQEFIAGTPNDMIGDTKIWVDSLLGMLSKSARILELGSGFGRDAAYMREKGYHPELTDGAQAFVDLLRSQAQPAQRLNIVTDDLGGGYDLVFANAVFEHVPPLTLRLVLDKVNSALRSSGVLGFGHPACWASVIRRAGLQYKRR